MGNVNENKIQPIVGHIYRCICEHWHTKGHREAILRRVAEDCEWRFADDNSEVSYAWNVIDVYEIPNSKAKKRA